MIAAGIVVFREVLEAALIITIVLAATRGVLGRVRWVSYGVLAGLSGSVVIALFVTQIAAFADGMGQEFFNAMVLAVAALLICWHVIWMASHGRQLADEVRAVGRDVALGVQHLSALAILVGFAVLREGAEVVLILKGMALSGESWLMIFEAGGIGFLAGVVVGLILYFGIIKLPIGQMFAFTNWLLILIAAGMMGKAAKYLVAADALPSLGYKLWDSNHLVAQDSIMGDVLSTLVGYSAQPSGMQLLVYALTIALVVLLSRHEAQKMKSAQAAMKASAAAE